MTSTRGKGAVLTTGANGFVGSHIVSLLLSRGYKVHATVRRQEAADQLANTFPSDRLRVFVIPELTEANALDEACYDCSFLIHMASTVPTKNSTPGNDRSISIDATVGSVEAIMLAAAKFDCQKVVVTSSMSTHLDAKATFLDETTWYAPDVSSTKPFIQYMSAKVLAEQRAWELSSSLGVPLTTIAPVYIGGPTILAGQDPKAPISNQDLLCCIQDEAKSKIPGWIDVRTVARLHLLALEADQMVGRRVLACTHNTGVVKMDCLLMNKLLANETADVIEFDQTKRDLLDQIRRFSSGRVSRSVV